MLSAKAANRKDLSAKPATMTHQHFRFIASVIRILPTRDCGKHEYVRQEIAEHFAGCLNLTNSRFDRARFLAACQLEGE